CQQNPWDAFASGYAKGDRISGVIKSITDFGIFIGLEGNIDGLVHLSDISWNETGEEAVRSYKKGDEIETVILSIDPERERISLGVKQLEDDPFNNYISLNDRGSIVNGEVVEVDAKLVTVKLAEEVLGTLKASDISRERVEDARNEFKVGDSVEAKIVSVDRKNRTASLSVKAKDYDDEQEAVQSMKEQDDASSPGTIGDLIKAQMGEK
ncbi:MAG: S1 RNA-binding domain-containing protein, partial [Pseudomonadota bacterium]